MDTATGLYCTASLPTLELSGRWCFFCKRMHTCVLQSLLCRMTPRENVYICVCVCLFVLEFVFFCLCLCLFLRLCVYLCECDSKVIVEVAVVVIVDHQRRCPIALPRVRYLMMMTRTASGDTMCGMGCSRGSVHARHHSVCACAMRWCPIGLQRKRSPGGLEACSA